MSMHLVSRAFRNELQKIAARIHISDRPHVYDPRKVPKDLTPSGEIPFGWKHVNLRLAQRLAPHNILLNYKDSDEAINLLNRALTVPLGPSAVVGPRDKKAQLVIPFRMGLDGKDVNLGQFVADWRDPSDFNLGHTIRTFRDADMGVGASHGQGFDFTSYLNPKPEKEKYRELMTALKKFLISRRK